jgi:FMN phosphatase YigB (HAD superfamily)
LDKNGCLLFDWGDTLMRDDPHTSGPMYAWEHVEMIPHADLVLGALRADWLIALATNAIDSDESDIRRALRRVGLNSLVDTVYCFREVGYRKPTREFFQYILDDLKLVSRQVIMIGDSFEKDVQGANEAGIRAIWFNPYTQETRTNSFHRTIHVLSELPGVLASLLPIAES